MIWHKDTHTHTHRQQGRVPLEVKKFFWLLQPIQLRSRLYSYSVSEAEPLPQLSRPLPSAAQPATGHGLAMWNKTWALIWETSRLTVPFLRFLYRIDKNISSEAMLVGSLKSQMVPGSIIKKYDRDITTDHDNHLSRHIQLHEDMLRRNQTKWEIMLYHSIPWLLSIRLLFQLRPEQFARHPIMLFRGRQEILTQSFNKYLRL